MHCNQSSIGYSSITTEVRAFPRGQNGQFTARVRSLTLNNQSRFGDSYSSTKDSRLKFSILGYSQEIANNFENTFSVNPNTQEFTQITGHSPIIDGHTMETQYTDLLVILIQII